MEFNNELNTYIRRINSALEENLPPPDSHPPLIQEAVRYSLFAGGKRLRPILALACARIAGGEEDCILPVACGLEMIHTYSLIHDDLPAMDDDDLRRGKPTCHKQYGEAVAILAGDALLTMAFECIARCRVNGPEKAERLLGVIVEIARAAGTPGMIGGQVLDITMDQESATSNDLACIHRKKTGALLEVSARSGAILSGTHPEVLEKITAYASHLGMAFQITDDVLDITGEVGVIGKPVGSDFKKKKATYPALYGIEEARSMAMKEMDAAMETLAGFGDEAAFLRELVKFVVLRNY